LSSDSNLTSKAYLNSIAASLDYGSHVVSSLILNPLLVTGMGDYLYGVWVFLVQVMNYASVASGRPTQALKWVIANKQSSDDYTDKQRVVGSALVTWLIFLPLVLAVGGVIAWISPAILDSPDAFAGAVRWTAVILTMDLCLRALADVPRDVMRGENLGYKRMGLSAMLILLGGLLVALALYSKSGIIGVAIATIIGTLIVGIAFWKVAGSHVHWFGARKPSLSRLRRYLGLSGWFLGWQAIMRFMLTGDVILLGLLENAKIVTVYTLTKYSTSMVLGLAAIVVTSITPGLGGLIGSGDYPKASRVRGEMMAMMWLFVVAAGSTILTWNRSFVALWIGEGYYAGRLETLLIIAMILQLVFIRSDANIIDLTLDVSNKVRLGVIATIASVLAATIFVRYYEYGISGLCLGIIVGRMLLSYGYPRIVGSALKLPLAAQIRSALRPALVSIIVLVLTYNLAGVFVATSWMEIVLFAPVTFLAVGIVSFFAGVPEMQRERILQRVRALV
jgi:O-antigen/teichoic acid export membrane protein